MVKPRIAEWGSSEYGENEPEWTEENQNRKQGDTNFEICGWCQHVKGGTCRYDCHLEPDGCDLMYEYDDRWQRQKEYRYDRPCVFITSGVKDLEYTIDSKKRSVKSHKRSIKEIEKLIVIIKKKKEKMDDRPSLPGMRHSDHFPLGESVMVAFRNDEKDETKGYRWVAGTAVFGYRTHDGMVSYHVGDGCCCGGGADPAEGKLIDPYDGSEEAKKLSEKIGLLARCGGSGNAVPTVILRSEYEWFAAHPKRWEDWIRACTVDKDYNGNIMSNSWFPIPVVVE